MIKKLKLYLDTSVPNFIFADDAPEKKEITIDFFENFVMTEYYNSFVSPVVLAEIEDTRNVKKRNDLLGVIEKYPIVVLDYNEEEEKEIQDLANEYVKNKIIPKKNFADALHIAISVVKRMDVLASWNYKHLANINREQRITVLNLSLGYRTSLRIITPMELIDYENKSI